MNNLVNLTPHVINVVACGQEVLVAIPPSGDVARCASTNVPRGIVNIINVNGKPCCGFQVEIKTPTIGEVVGLPPFQEGTFYLVSLVVRQASPTRGDLYSPGDLLRGADGQPMGCKFLSVS